MWWSSKEYLDYMLSSMKKTVSDHLLIHHDWLNEQWTMDDGQNFIKEIYFIFNSSILDYGGIHKTV